MRKQFVKRLRCRTYVQNTVFGFIVLNTAFARSVSALNSNNASKA